jgi:hypothetical protein
VCARVGSQRSRGVVTARVQTDAVRSLRHQRRDLPQLTYPYLSEDRGSSYYHLSRFWKHQRGLRETRRSRCARCSHHTEEEATWEREEELKVEFPSFFFDPSDSRGRDSF